MKGEKLYPIFFWMTKKNIQHVIQNRWSVVWMTIGPCIIHVFSRAVKGSGILKCNHQNFPQRAHSHVEILLHWKLKQEWLCQNK
ncbi:hypothetical protein GDO81_016962 [Engystomops pustulosus]|uniref:Uncharacterized protein n=1 Tax=Engystomops pustulosus TaxID=76066 RepID=A0AAV7AI15_ENGPU|nr:hypothetical protein GDO81_016962 [Engystomops pustulosus]